MHVKCTSIAMHNPKYFAVLKERTVLIILHAKRDCFKKSTPRGYFRNKLPRPDLMRVPGFLRSRLHLDIS